jgi:hypothetical protein
MARMRDLIGHHYYKLDPQIRPGASGYFLCCPGRLRTCSAGGRGGSPGHPDDAVDGSPVCIPKLHGDLVVGEAGCAELDSPSASGSRKGTIAMLTMDPWT